VKKEEAQELLRKYRQGQCTEKEIQIINRWYESLDNESLEMSLSDADDLNNLRKQMHENITGNIDKAEKNKVSTQEGEEKVKRLTFFNFQNLKKLAAVLLVGLGAVIFFSKQQDASFKEDKVVLEEVGSKEKPPSTIYLPDGSVVWLKEKSRLEYPNSFTGSTREVTLTGEAFFDVAKDQERPFIIQSTYLTTRVTGTRFNIKAYENEELQEVTVITGEVIVTLKKSASDKVEEVVLKPNQKAIYLPKKNSLLESSEVDQKKYSSLVESKLDFNEVSLEDIIAVLNATHNANISVSNEQMKNCIITADLTNESLETSIAVISRAINAEYAITENHIILSGLGCQ
jgi:transmembrane sensor